MASIPLHYVDLRTFCYATEDADRVETALRRFLPEEFEIERATTEGHMGDRILVLSARLENAADVRVALDALADLPESDRERLIDELDERVDDNTAFFMTLDKQAAYNGSVSLGDGITFRAKIEAYPAKKAAAVENMREVLEQL